MTDPRRVVFDSSVLVSAAIFGESTPRQAVAIALEEKSILLSSAVLDELTEVLARPKFDRYASLDLREHFIALLTRAATMLDPLEAIDACRDPKDNKFLELAVAGNAAYLISGDADLLVLNPFRGILVLTPAEFLKLPREQPDTEDVG